MTEVISKQQQESSSSSSILADTNNETRRIRRSLSRRSNISSTRKLMVKQKQHSISINKDIKMVGDTDDDHSHSSSVRLHRVRSPKTPPSTSSSSLSSSSASTSAIKASVLGNAEAKIQSIVQARKVKERRRSDLSQSLDSAMLRDSNDDDNKMGDKNQAKEEHNDNEIEVVQEEGEGEETGSLALNEGESSKTEGRRRQSPRLMKRRVITRDQRRNMVRTFSQGSLRLQKEEQRQRSKDGDDSSGLNAVKSPVEMEGSQALEHEQEQKQSPKSTKVRSKATIQGGDNESNTNETRARRYRSKSRSRPRDGRSKSRPRDSRSVDPKRRVRRNRSSSRGADSVRDRNKDPVSRRSRSKSRPRSHDDGDDDDKSVTSRMSTATSATANRRGRRPLQKKHPSIADDTSDDNDDDDMKSVASVKSMGSRMSSASAASTANRRGRRPTNSAHHSRKTPAHSNTSLHSPGNSSIETGNDGESPPPSPVTYKVQSAQSLDKHFVSHPPLGRHIESNKIKTQKDTLSIVEERSTESSRFSGMKTQPILLQFDPTNENLVRTVNQTTAKKTTETIHQSDGKTSKFEVSEIEGLPNFEKSFSASELNGSEIATSESTRSMISSDGGSSVEGGHSSKPASFLSMGSNKPGSSKSVFGVSQASSETPRQRGALGNNLQAKKSAFMLRVQNMKNPRLGRGAHRALDDDDDSESLISNH